MELFFSFRKWGQEHALGPPPPLQSSLPQPKPFRSTFLSKSQWVRSLQDRASEMWKGTNNSQYSSDNHPSNLSRLGLFVFPVAPGISCYHIYGTNISSTMTNQGTVTENGTGEPENPEEELLVYRVRQK